MSSLAAGRIFLPLECADNLHDGYFKAFAAGGLDLLLVQRGGVPTVLEGICPHAGHPLAAARIMGADLRCDMHGYRFDLRTGACTYFTEGPCRGLQVYAHAVQDGVIGVLLGEVAVPGQLGENPASTLESNLTDTPTDTLPDRLSVDPASRYYDEKLLARNVGIRFNGVERTNVEEYCVSEGWIRSSVGKTLDRRGKPLTVQLKGAVEPFFKD